jgi:hypothetical protein
MEIDGTMKLYYTIHSRRRGIEENTFYYHRTENWMELDGKMNWVFVLNSRDFRKTFANKFANTFLKVRRVSHSFRVIG